MRICADVPKLFASIVQGKADTNHVVLLDSSAGCWISLFCGTGIGFEESGLPKPLPAQGIATIGTVKPRVSESVANPVANVVPITLFILSSGAARCNECRSGSGAVADCNAVSTVDANPLATIFATNFETRGLTVPNIPYHTPSRTWTGLFWQRKKEIASELSLGHTGIEPIAYTVVPALESLAKLPGNTPCLQFSLSTDTKVPVVQARDVAATLEKLKKTGVSVKHEYEEVEGVDHLYDRESSCEMERMYNVARFSNCE
ncbi:hypothetical protein K435DRAFT_859430 [Dendrothele bispora CBS 962.96]|uniref:Alpha/beta-hydrolase n=1 Tax=Dendrothele bispora (strain CBS 962.96) TaxID=1314807 RepID=A0A4S8M0J9_DENBC|nr:hypothetical protein K435DRAFT_859430 [Dendrothele bispora CBS 962.96]